MYLRFTRNDGECVRFDDGSMRTSYFNRSRGTLFFIHGYLASGDDWYVNDLKNTLVDKVRHGGAGLDLGQEALHS